MAVEVVKQQSTYNRYRVVWDGRPMACLNLDSDDPRFDLPRPTLHPVYTPDGYPLTEHGAHNFPHQHGIWLSHGSVNRVDFYLDRSGCGRVEVRSVAIDPLDGGVELRLANHWLDPSGRPLLAEDRSYWFRPLLVGAADRGVGGPRAHLIQVSSTLRADFGRVTLAKTPHAFFGARVIDAIDEDDGGVLRNSLGGVGEAGTNEVAAGWVDCSGTIAGRRVGLTLMVHPSSTAQPIRTRSYGSIMANPFARRGVTLKQGAEFTQTYGVLAHDGDADDIDVDSAFGSFAGRPAGPARLAVVPVSREAATPSRGSRR